MTSWALSIAALSEILGALALVVFGAGGNLLVVIPALVVFGLVGDVDKIAAMTYFQHKLPDAVHGRFFSLSLMTAGGGGLVDARAGPTRVEGIGADPVMTVLSISPLPVAVVFGVREGGFRLSNFPFVPARALEPDIVGHGIWRVPSQSSLLPDAVIGGPVLQPRLRSMV